MTLRIKIYIHSLVKETISLSHFDPERSEGEEPVHGESVRGESVHGEPVHGESAHGETVQDESMPLIPFPWIPALVGMIFINILWLYLDFTLLNYL